MTAPTANPVEEAREAIERRQWQQALDLLTGADAASSLTASELALLAEVAYAAGRLDLTIEAWERAHALSMRAGDRLAAAGAAVRLAMHLLLDTALMAPVRGWVGRAERLLDGTAETPVHAWLAVVRNYERMLSGDFDGARQWARKAIDLGTRCNPTAAALGRIAEARCLILAGNVPEGLAFLDDAAIATLSGELDPLSRGIVYCEVVCAFQALGQYDLAEEWSAAMERWCPGEGVGSIHGRCRVHRAEILRLRGACVEAEQQALLACEELRPYLRREFGWPLTELGRIRLRRGNIAGAEAAFRAAHEVGWDAQPGLALVQLEKGEVAPAARSIREALENPLYVPSKELPPNTELRRVPLLEAQVDIELAAEDLGRAREAADQLSQIAARFGRSALVAGASLAQGKVRLAAGDTAGARRRFEVARDLWSEIGAPYEMALARMGLAHAHRAEGNEQLAVPELEAARSAFERVGGVGREAEAARAYGLASPPATAIAARDTLFRREGDFWSLSFDGRTVRVRDLRGLHYLARLLADPGREFHVLDLVAGAQTISIAARATAEDGLTIVTDTNAGVLLDARSRQAYRRRLAETEADLDEARALADDGRIAQSEAERDFLLRELARAVGLGGRDRHAGSASERARASVTRAVRHALARIREHHPTLGEHLDRATRTGTYCAYLPDPRVPTAWKL